MANPKTTLYVGGLDESVTDAVMHAAFLPFGEIKDVNMPLEHESQKNRGFGFVTFVEKDDAAEAMNNMHNSELYGRVLRCNYAQPPRIKGGEHGFSTQPVWADADQYSADAAAEQEAAAAAEREAEGGADPMAAAEQEAVAA
mmetsp:Transcript_21311/g.52621  ORF Transcript_21311/g.52621 Transcript_21311/m.52621 type:complete len:142 (-) Transcript_21311:434-859(-)